MNARPTAPNHPGMSADFYHRAVARAAKAGIRCRPVVGLEDTYSVDSQSGAWTYLVRLGRHQDCGCEAHERHGRCTHRAVAIDLEFTEHAQRLRESRENTLLTTRR